MPTFLDLRTSQGIATGNLATGNGTFLGAIGLQVDAATGIRVALGASVGVTAGSAAFVTIRILRNIPASSISTTFNAANVIYAQTSSLEAGENKVLTVNAADFGPSSSSTEPGQINYSLWVSSTTTNTVLTGPQTLYGIAAS